MFWVPQTGSIGIGVSILSYDGEVHFGLIADARLIPDPQDVIRRFGEEFDKLLYPRADGGLGRHARRQKPPPRCSRGGLNPACPTAG